MGMRLVLSWGYPVFYLARKGYHSTMFEVTDRGRKPVSFLTAQTTYQRLEDSTLPHTWVGSPELLPLHPVPYCPASRGRSYPTPGDSMPLCPGLNRVQETRRDLRALCGLLVLGPGNASPIPRIPAPLANSDLYS